MSALDHLPANDDVHPARVRRETAPTAADHPLADDSATTDAAGYRFRIALRRERRERTRLTRRMRVRW